MRGVAGILPCAVSAHKALDQLRAGTGPVVIVVVAGIAAGGVGACCLLLSVAADRSAARSDRGGATCRQYSRKNKKLRRALNLTKL